MPAATGLVSAPEVKLFALQTDDWPDPANYDAFVGAAKLIVGLSDETNEVINVSNFTGFGVQPNVQDLEHL